MKYYVLSIWGDIEPMPLDGPYDTEKERDDKAREIKLKDITNDFLDDGGIFRLNVSDEGIPIVETYAGYELDPDQ